MKQEIHDHPKMAPECDGTAKYTTFEGWVSRHGIYFGPHGEQDARSAGSEIMSCSKPGHGLYPKGSMCAVCSEEIEDAMWAKCPKMSDEELPVDSTYFLYHGEEFFSDADAVVAYCEENDLSEVRLLVGEPIQLKLDDAEDLFWEYMPDDVDVPDEARDIIRRAQIEIAALPSVGYQASRYGYLFVV